MAGRHRRGAMANAVPPDFSSAGPDFRAKLHALAALSLAVALTWESAALLRQDLSFTAAETEVSFWGRGSYQPTAATRAATGRQLEWLLAGSPGHPGYLTLAANYHAWEGFWADTPEAEQEHNGQALAAQFLAQQHRPAYRPGWEKLLGYARRVAGGEAVAALAQQRLATLAAEGSSG